jgi:hypothetical protein
MVGSIKIRQNLFTGFCPDKVGNLCRKSGMDTVESLYHGIVTAKECWEFYPVCEPIPSIEKSIEFLYKYFGCSDRFSADSIDKYIC